MTTFMELIDALTYNAYEDGAAGVTRVSERVQRNRGELQERWDAALEQLARLRDGDTVRQILDGRR